MFKSILFTRNAVSVLIRQSSQKTVTFFKIPFEGKTKKFTTLDEAAIRLSFST